MAYWRLPWLLAIISMVVLSGDVRADDAEAPCQPNPFYPVEQGASWTYRETTATLVPGFEDFDEKGAGPEKESSTVVYTRQPVSASVFVEKVKSVDRGNSPTMDQSLHCTPEGMRGRTVLEGLSALMRGIDLAKEKREGVDLPLLDRWKVGSRWVSIVDAEAKPNAGNGLKHVTGRTESHIVALENVKVPAGTFDALKVVSTTSVDADTDEGKQKLLTGKTTSWYARDVGLVKSSATSKFGEVMQNDTALELEAFTREPHPQN